MSSWANSVTLRPAGGQIYSSASIAWGLISSMSTHVFFPPLLHQAQYKMHVAVCDTRINALSRWGCCIKTVCGAADQHQFRGLITALDGPCSGPLRSWYHSLPSSFSSLAIFFFSQHFVLYNICLPCLWRCFAWEQCTGICASDSMSVQMEGNVMAAAAARGDLTALSVLQ